MKTTIITLSLLVAGLGRTQTVSNFLNVENPGSIEVDAKGNFWVSYHTDGNYRLAKITPGGLFLPIIEEEFELSSFGVNDNFIWISSTANGKVYKYTRMGVKVDSVNVATPEDIVLHSDGSWHLSQSQSSRILSYSADNTQNIAATGLPLNYNVGLAFDEEGFMYTSNRYDGNVVRINPTTGTKSVIATLPRHTPYSLGYIAYRDGYVYVASGMNCIYKADTAGTELHVFAGVEGVAGDSQGNAWSALMDEPMGVAFSVTGDTLFVSDAANNNVKAISGMSSLGKDEFVMDKGVVRLFPVPAIVEINLQVKGQRISSFEITDPNSRMVSTPSVSGVESVKLDVSQLAAGTYFVKVITENGDVVCSKFTKT